MIRNWTLNLFAVLALYSWSGLWGATHNDFGRTDTVNDIIPAKELRQRLEIFGEIFVTNLQGRVLFQAEESRLWKFGLSGDILSNWSYKAPYMKELALQQTWTLKDDGRIFAHIRQFDTMKRDKEDPSKVLTGKLLREQEIEVKDFGPITWVAYEGEERRVIVRLTPRLNERVQPIEVDHFPLTLSSPIVFDSNGHLWAEGKFRLEGRYVSMRTHLGQFAISYSPFKGAKEIGVAEGNQIRISTDPNTTLHIRSERPILTASTPAKIYGIVDLKKRSHSVNSVSTSVSSKEKEFLEHMK